MTLKKSLFTSFFLLICAAGFITTTHTVLADPPPDPTTLPAASTPAASTPITNTDLTNYTLLAPLPLTNPQGNTLDTSINIANYIPNAVRLIIALATGLAVLMIIFGGFQYIASTIPNVKTNGKDMINNALIGLLLIVASYSILYTLNPRLVNLSLSISKLADAPAISTTLAPGATPTTTGGTPSNTTVTPNTGQGALVGVNNCGTSCVSVVTGKDFPAKGPNGGACTGDTCYVDPALYTVLTSVNQTLSQAGDKWTVNEMTPPTVKHNDYCHSNGTCVDASLETPTTANIITLFKTLDSTPGVTSYEYEACGSTLTTLQSEPKFEPWIDKFKCETSTQNGSTGQSFHINGPNAHSS